MIWKCKYSESFNHLSFFQISFQLSSKVEIYIDGCMVCHGAWKSYNFFFSWSSPPLSGKHIVSDGLANLCQTFYIKAVVPRLWHVWRLIKWYASRPTLCFSLPKNIFTAYVFTYQVLSINYCIFVSFHYCFVKTARLWFLTVILFMPYLCQVWFAKLLMNNIW